MTNARLAGEKQFFEAIAEQTLDALSVADGEGRYTYVNRAFCAMVGYTEAELLEMTVFDVTSDSQDRATFAETKGQGEGMPVLVVLKRKDSTSFLAEVVGKNIRHGEQESVLGVVRDVTERERLAEEKRTLERDLLHSQKIESLAVLAGGVAHDFNNLLAVILGNANLALEDIPRDSSAVASLKDIEDAAQRAAELSSQMLAYSGKGQFVIGAVDVHELIEGMAELLKSTTSKKVRLEFDLGVRVPSFLGDVSQLHQVLVNLITNAAEAIGDDVGVISVRAGSSNFEEQDFAQFDGTLRASLEEPLEAGAYTTLEIADTGCGMDAETAERIFDPFFTTKFTGRGLGMAAVLGILRGHGAAMRIESVLGEGTTMTLAFPATAITQDLGSSVTHSPDVRGWQGAGTALVVDDERTVRLVSERMLKRLGFDVLSACDGRGALALHERHAAEIRFVLLDLTMPEMDGLEVFDELRRRDPLAKVVLCSGYNEREATDRFTGLAAFLQKPYSLSMLETVLASVLG